MTDTLELLGVIVTWLAAMLATIALAGIIRLTFSAVSRRPTATRLSVLLTTKRMSMSLEDTHSCLGTGKALLPLDQGPGFEATTGVAFSPDSSLLAIGGSMDLSEFMTLTQERRSRYSRPAKPMVAR